jgi:hypothetical protein
MACQRSHRPEVRRSSEIQLCGVQGHNHLHQLSLVVLVAATHLDADAVVRLLHGGIVGAQLDFLQRALAVRGLSCDGGPDRMQRLEPHLAIVAGGEQSNAIALSAGAKPIIDACACDSEWSEPR